MARAARTSRSDSLSKWLALSWDRPERSYNPDVRDFLADLLGYPKDHVITEDSGAEGYPDLQLITTQGKPWVVGDLKKDDDQLLIPERRTALWQEKKKYVQGLTLYVLFLTPHYLILLQPTGAPVAGFEVPIDLTTITVDLLRERLDCISAAAAEHRRIWSLFIKGDLPYCYLAPDDPSVAFRLKADLQSSFNELNQAAARGLGFLRQEYKQYQRCKEEAAARSDAFRGNPQRLRSRLEEQYHHSRQMFEETLPLFESKYGRDLESGSNQRARIEEAFVADTVAALMARVLFLRLAEDIQLSHRRRLSNGGPANWASFVETLTGDARTLVRIAAADLANIYREPFSITIFDWINQVNGELDTSLQTFILRMNAYNFSHLSEEVLGEIYQEFLPPAKRKRLGEYYTPLSVVDWIFKQTVWEHGFGPILDPSSGSGKFPVTYVHQRLADAHERGLDLPAVCRELEQEIWAFDLNPFAAFLTYFQILWALIRQMPHSPPKHLHVYNLNSLVREDQLVADLALLSAGEQARDGVIPKGATCPQKWRYVVGNPPYIRAERVKDSNELSALWSEVWGQNADTGLVFLYRSLREWLVDGGYFGMVVSGGYANSEAAAKVWKLLYPGGTAALRKLVWFEFVEEQGRQKPIWDVARVPMVLIIEKASAAEDDFIEIYRPSEWPGAPIPVKVRYADFFDRKISPKMTDNSGTWGEYLIPLLNPEDAPLLRKLFPDGNTLVTLDTVVRWTYGIQRGGVDVASEPDGELPIQVVAGRGLAMGWPGEPAGWVDLKAIEERPYGKLSLWKDQKNLPVSTLEVAELASAPFAAVAKNMAAVNTIVVGSTKSGTPPEAVAAYLNSSLARFYWAVRLRSGVIQGYYSHIYPRILENLPWPKVVNEADNKRLALCYEKLHRLAFKTKDNPKNWFLNEAEQRIKNASLKLSDPQLGLKFQGWVDDMPLDELNLAGNRIWCGLFSFDVLDADLAEYLFNILTFNRPDDGTLKTEAIQVLLVPSDYPKLMAAYRSKTEAFQKVEQEFLSALSEIDEEVFAVFGLSNQEQSYIQSRLSSFPLDRLQPRYPWDIVSPRPIKAYMEDRFA